MSLPPRSPDGLALRPFGRPPHARVRVPGSKSITNRALILAALCSSQMPCTLTGVLQSEDTEVLVQALGLLGFNLRCSWNQDRIEVALNSTGRIVPAREADLSVANSGTSMRFLTALAALGDGRYCLDGVARMRERPIQDLLSALEQLGARARAVSNNGCPPVVLDACGLDGGNVSVRGDISSQFLSAIMMVAPWARAPVTIRVDGALVSAPYIAMTLAMMRHWGLTVTSTLAGAEDGMRMDVGSAGQAGIPTFAVEPDASAASYFLGAAAVTGGQVGIEGLDLRNSLQGDVEFARCLVDMGCTLVADSPVTVRGGALRGIDVDMNAISDCVMTLAAVACFAEGPTTLRNIAHIRHKETDRLNALATELARLGAGVEQWDEGMRIIPRPLQAAAVETYDDHRMAMSLALVGLRIPGLVVKDPGCVRKTYPHFFADLEKLRPRE